MRVEEAEEGSKPSSVALGVTQDLAWLKEQFQSWLTSTSPVDLNFQEPVAL